MLEKVHLCGSVLQVPTMEMIVRRAFSYSSKQSVSLGNQVVLNVHSMIKVITECLLRNWMFLQLRVGGMDEPLAYKQSTNIVVSPS